MLPPGRSLSKPRSFENPAVSGGGGVVRDLLPVWGHEYFVSAKAIAILCLSVYSIDILTNEPDERWKCRAYVVSVKNERSTYERPSVWNVALYPPTVPTQVSSLSLHLTYFTINQSYANFIHARPLPFDAWKWPIRFRLQQLIVCMMSSVKAVFRQDKTNCRGFRVSPYYRKSIYKGIPCVAVSPDDWDDKTEKVERIGNYRTWRCWIIVITFTNER